MESEKLWQQITAILLANIRKVIGGLLGLIFAILVLTLGLTSAVLIALFSILGAIIGSREDLKEDFWQIAERILPGKFS